MGRYKDLIGQKFGKLTVIALDEERTEQSLEERRKKIRTRSRVYWNCLCDCGNMKSVRQDSLISGKIKTCTKCNTISKIPKFFHRLYCYYLIPLIQFLIKNMSPEQRYL